MPPLTGVATNVAAPAQVIVPCCAVRFTDGVTDGFTVTDIVSFGAVPHLKRYVPATVKPVIVVLAKETFVIVVA